jgi:hypothetical protein
MNWFLIPDRVNAEIAEAHKTNNCPAAHECIVCFGGFLYVDDIKIEIDARDVGVEG